MVSEPAASSPAAANRRSGLAGRAGPPAAAGLSAAVGDGCVQVAIGGRGWLGDELQPVNIAVVDPLEPAWGIRFCHGDQAAGAPTIRSRLGCRALVRIALATCSGG
jgi:hypothetical protein